MTIKYADHATATATAIDFNGVTFRGTLENLLAALNTTRGQFVTLSPALRSRFTRPLGSERRRGADLFRTAKNESPVIASRAGYGTIVIRATLSEVHVARHQGFSSVAGNEVLWHHCTFVKSERRCFQVAGAYAKAAEILKIDLHDEVVIVGGCLRPASEA